MFLQMALFQSFLWMSSIPLYIYITSSLSIHLSIDILVGYVLVNSAAVKIGVDVSFCIILFSGYMPRNEIAGPYGNAIFSFLRNSILFSKMVAPIYIPNNRIGYPHYF